MKFCINDHIYIKLSDGRNIPGVITSFSKSATEDQTPQSGMYYDVVMDGDPSKLSMEFAEEELAHFKTPDTIFKDILKWHLSVNSK